MIYIKRLEVRRIGIACTQVLQASGREQNEKRRYIYIRSSSQIINVYKVYSTERKVSLEFIYIHKFG